MNLAELVLVAGGEHTRSKDSPGDPGSDCLSSRRARSISCAQGSPAGREQHREHAHCSTVAHAEAVCACGNHVPSLCILCHTSGCEPCRCCQYLSSWQIAAAPTCKDGIVLQSGADQICRWYKRKHALAICSNRVLQTCSLLPDRSEQDRIMVVICAIHCCAEQPHVSANCQPPPNLTG